MINKKQIVSFIISFAIGGFFLLTFLPLTPNAHAGVEGPIVCCDAERNGLTCEVPVKCVTETGSCLGEVSSPRCDDSNLTVSCTCPEPISTLSEWGKILTIAVIGLFALIGLIVMRRKSLLGNST